MKFSSSVSTAHRPRRRGLLAVLIVAVIAVLAAGLTILAVRAQIPILPLADAEAGESIIELWQAQEYETLLAAADVELRREPFDETALTLRGFARFYLAMREVDSEARQNYLIGSVQDLRRVMLLPDPVFARQTHYILGKTYFHRGLYFYDSAIFHLRQARAAGLEHLDLLEYLAIASRDLGDTEASANYFREAIARGDESIHRVTLADLLIEERQHSEADLLLAQAIERTNDITILQHGLLSLGRSQRAQEFYDQALETYGRVLEINPASADAHYGLGEVYFAQGSSDLARFQWREAVRLDPNHIESLQRLQDN